MPDLLTTLSESGWTRVPSVVQGLDAAGLPVPTRRFLHTAFTEADWARCHEAVTALSEAFDGCRFADEATWGPVLVPDPARLDTRRPAAPALRADQSEITREDFAAPTLPAGVNVCPPGAPWALVVTITSSSGLAMGSLEEVAAADDRFAVQGSDTRTLMLRQVWGALTLQSAPELPDSERRTSWTFTLFAGDDLVDGKVASGTVLHGQARQRLGKTTRGIVSARVRPGLFIAGAR